MRPCDWCQDAYLLYGMIIVSRSWSGVMYVWIKIRWVCVGVWLAGYVGVWLAGYRQ